MNGGLWEAARRGALRTHVPIGYQHDREGRIVKVLDEAIRESISLIFSKFAELRSARQVTTYLAEEGVLLPHRRVDQVSVSWRRATFWGGAWRVDQSDLRRPVRVWTVEGRAPAR